MPIYDTSKPVAVIALAATVLLTGAAHGQPLTHDRAQLDSGEKLFSEQAGDTGCAVCHGDKAIGSADTGAPFIQGVSRAQLNAALSGAVPAMEYFDLNRREVDDIYEYLLYLGHAEDATSDSDVAAGKVIFEETAGGVGCQSCHGIDASGDSAPDIRGQDARAILDQLRRNENMRFIELSKSEIDQVAAYLQFLHELPAH